jgi:hypothetical protein
LAITVRARETTVRNDDRRAPRGLRGARAGGAGRKEEMRENDVGAPPQRNPDGLTAETSVLGRRAAPAADRHEFDLVAERLELALDGNQKAPEVRVLPTGPHLSHEEDSHGHAA